jgi:hypothetical protein
MHRPIIEREEGGRKEGRKEGRKKGRRAQARKLLLVFKIQFSGERRITKQNPS